jgi:hypothetical protein
LLKIGQLKEHPPDAAEVQRLLAPAARNLPDAQVRVIDFDIPANNDWLAVDGGVTKC